MVLYLCDTVSEARSTYRYNDDSWVATGYAGLRSLKEWGRDRGGIIHSQTHRHASSARLNHAHEHTTSSFKAREVHTAR